MADSDTRSGKAALLTVGSTQFAALVEAALRAETLAVLRDAGYTRFVVQYGKQDRPRLSTSHEGPKIQVELHAFLSDIEEKMQTVDLVLSHAGVSHCTVRLSSSRLWLICPRSLLSCMLLRRCWIHPRCSERTSLEPSCKAKAARYRAERRAHGRSSV
jgi:beta-1,4-N-acetylglucosaminyltransferase